MSKGKTDSSNLYLLQEEYCQRYGILAGTDEAGRGPLAGPVVAAAVILPVSPEIVGLNDSKKINQTKREELYVAITGLAVSWTVVLVEAEEIDRINILQASLLAMRTAVGRLSMRPNHVLVDGNKITDFGGIPATAIVKGDARLACIAAASIIAKVERDRLMLKYHEQYPQYGFDKHKGYPTAAHLKALQKFGPCPIHRKSYGPVNQLTFKL